MFFLPDYGLSPSCRHPTAELQLRIYFKNCNQTSVLLRSYSFKPDRFKNPVSLLYLRTRYIASTMESMLVGSAWDSLDDQCTSGEHTRGTRMLTESAATRQNVSLKDTHMDKSI